MPPAPEALLNTNLDADSGTKETAWEKSIENAWVKMHDDYGIVPFVAYWGVFQANPTGGQTQSAAWFQLLQFGGQIEFERYGWKGGSFYASGSFASGHDLSESLGNVFTVSQSVVGMKGVGLNEVYFTQMIGENDFLQLRLGRMAAGSSFATLPIEGLAVSGAAAGNPFSLYTNIPFESSTGATWAAFVRVNPTPDTYAQVGVYQADPRADVTDYHGLNVSLRPSSGVLSMVETGWTPTFGQTPDTVSPDGKTKVPGPPGLPGVYEVGAYYSNAPFDSFVGDNQSNAYGFYLQAQQMVWRDPTVSALNLTLWGGMTCSPQDRISLLPVMGFGGVDLHGPIPGRRDDSVFLNGYLGHFSTAYSSSLVTGGDAPATMEKVLDMGYVVQVSKNVQFQPDVQVILQPGGTTGIPNAVVLGFQVSAIF